jgi:hypothetical protein
MKSICKNEKVDLSFLIEKNCNCHVGKKKENLSDEKFSFPTLILFGKKIILMQILC